MGQAVGRSRTIDEHIQNESAERAKERVKNMLEKQRFAECTFKPQIHSAPDGGTASAPLQLRLASEPDTVSARVDEYIRVRFDCCTAHTSHVVFWSRTREHVDAHARTAVRPTCCRQRGASELLCQLVFCATPVIFCP